MNQQSGRVAEQNVGTGIALLALNSGDAENL